MDKCLATNSFRIQWKKPHRWNLTQLPAGHIVGFVFRINLSGEWFIWLISFPRNTKLQVQSRKCFELFVVSLLFVVLLGQGPHVYRANKHFSPELHSQPLKALKFSRYITEAFNFQLIFVELSLSYCLLWGYGVWHYFSLLNPTENPCQSPVSVSHVP